MIELTPGQQQFIDAQVATGMFSQPREVIDAALKLLAARQSEYSQLQTAMGQVERGEISLLDMADIKSRGRDRKATQ